MTMSASESRTLPDTGTGTLPAAVPWSTKDFLLLFSAIARVTTGPNHRDRSAQDKPMTAQSAHSIPWTTVKQLTASCPLASPHLQRASIAQLEWYYGQFIAAEPFGQGLSLHVILQVLFSRRLRELFNDLQSEDQSLREELRELGALPLPTQAQQLSLATGSTSNPHAAVPDALRSPIAAALTPLSPAITLSDGPLSPQVIPLGSPRPHSSFHSYLTTSSISSSSNPTHMLPLPSIHHHQPSSDASTAAVANTNTSADLSDTDDPMTGTSDLDSSPSVYLPHRPSQSFTTTSSTSRAPLDAAHAGGPRSTSVTPTPRSPSVFHAGGGAPGSGPPAPHPPPAKPSSSASASASSSRSTSLRRGTALDDATPRRPRSPPKLVLKSTFGPVLAPDGDGGVPLPAHHVRSGLMGGMDAESTYVQRPLALRRPANAAPPALDAAAFPPPPMHSPAWTDASAPSTPLDDAYAAAASSSSRSSSVPAIPASSSSSTTPALTRHARGGTPGTRARRASLKQANDRHRHWRKSCLRKWDDIADARLGHTFSAAIKADNAHNYRAVIRHPMDLKSVKQRLREGKTSSTDGFHRDLVLMMANARMYYGNMGDWKGLVDEMKGEIDRQLTEFRVMERMANARMGAGGQAGASASGSSAGSSAASSSADLTGVVVKVEQVDAGL